MYIIIDNALAFCPECELSSRKNGSILHEKEYQKRISPITILNSNRSSWS